MPGLMKLTSSMSCPRWSLLNSRYKPRPFERLKCGSFVISARPSNAEYMVANFRALVELKKKKKSPVPSLQQSRTVGGHGICPSIQPHLPRQDNIRSHQHHKVVILPTNLFVGPDQLQRPHDAERTAGLRDANPAATGGSPLKHREN